MRHLKSTIITTSNDDGEKGNWTFIFMIYFNDLPRLLHGMTEENHEMCENIVDSSNEIRTWNFPSRNKSRYRRSKMIAARKGSCKIFLSCYVNRRLGIYVVPMVSLLCSQCIPARSVVYRYTLIYVNCIILLTSVEATPAA